MAHIHNDSYQDQHFRFFQDWWAKVTHGAKKWWVICWNEWPKHIKLSTVDIWVVNFTYTLTQTLVCIYILTADYTVKPVLSGNSKKINYRLMQVTSLSYYLLLRSLFCLF